MVDGPHPDARAFLERAEAAPDLHALPAAEARAVHRELSTPAGHPEPVQEVHDVVVRGDGHGLPLRVYVPVEEARPGDGPRPVLVRAHGGGWVLGDLETGDPTGRGLANATGCVVEHRHYDGMVHTFLGKLGEGSEPARRSRTWAGTS